LLSSISGDSGEDGYESNHEQKACLESFNGLLHYAPEAEADSRINESSKPP